MNFNNDVNMNSRDFCKELSSYNQINLQVILHPSLVALLSRHRSISSAVMSALLWTSFSQFESHPKKLSIHCNKTYKFLRNHSEILLILNT